MRQIRGPARITDWSAFRTTPFPLLPSPQDYQAWAPYALHTHQSYIRCICTSTSAPAVDPHLLLLWEARRSLTRRWRRYKLNRKLRSRIQALTAEAADYSAQLADTNWVDTCMKAAGQMSSKSAWRLFMSLLDPSTTRGETQRQLRRAYYAYPGPTSQLANDLFDRYLCRTVDPKGPEYHHKAQMAGLQQLTEEVRSLWDIQQQCLEQERRSQGTNPRFLQLLLSALAHGASQAPHPLQAPR
ncbi:hypothetical protein HPB49_019278 [Dermacentor silvarum]|uniref:Uncharacterized protein n=1 Tax=Dermacentor silvarum TaxID=543639 RepID=A0ACB8D7N7_DERSI|nr:hypothetical protein HPB49_019278 [Dermacentor silvarum]